jgi:hypothetical protein
VPEVFSNFGGARKSGVGRRDCAVTFTRLANPARIQPDCGCNYRCGRAVSS